MSIHIERHPALLVQQCLTAAAALAAHTAQWPETAPNAEELQTEAQTLQAFQAHIEPLLLKRREANSRGEREDIDAALKHLRIQLANGIISARERIRQLDVAIDELYGPKPEIKLKFGLIEEDAHKRTVEASPSRRRYSF